MEHPDLKILPTPQSRLKAVDTPSGGSERQQARSVGASFLLAAHTAALPDDGQAPSFVHLLPNGEFTGRDGRGPWTFGVAECARVIAEFDARKMPLAIDYEHQSLKVDDNGKPAPAAGWIVALESRADGLWGKVEWTAAAANYISQREYRYLSPVFYYDEKTNRVMALSGCGLTNSPNLFFVEIR